MSDRDNILVIADEEYQAAYSDILMLEQYQVTTAASKEEAAGFLRHKSFVVILISLPLQASQGDPVEYVQELLAEIRNSERTPARIIVLHRDRSASGNILRRLFGNHDVSDFLVEPVTADEILESVRYSIRNPRGLPESQNLLPNEPFPPGEVAFTSYYPREGNVETWHTLLVYIHLITAMIEVLNDAKRFRSELPLPKQVSSSASTRIARGTEITIVPSCEGVEFNPARLTVKWMEDYHRADFRFRADRSLLNDAAKGVITFFVGPVIVGTLKFAMLFSDQSEDHPLEPEDSSTMYKGDKIFISYSHKDAEVATLFRNVLEATGYDVLIDIDDLRAGQVWNEELMHMIERADIFQLFWSVNSSQSAYCQKEWQHALKQNKGEGYIRPVYWQKPLPTPPAELSKYHFDYVDLKVPA